MRKRYALGLVGAAILAGALVLRPWATSEPSTDGGETDAPITHEKPSPRSGSRYQDDAPPPAPKVTEKKRKVDDAERERYRRAIRDAIAQRDTRAAPSPRPASDEPPVEDQGGQGGDGLKDRSGGKLAGLLKDLQDDVMPLADECYAQALERDPSIAGGLGLQFAIIGDEDVGGLVESVELEDGSDIQDPEMLECMRETLLSTIFPAPDDSGETGVRLTLEFSPDE